ncbi:MULTISPECIES: helix-turn-helix transcriptional regulator [Rodentibacter]|uniref:helix-turn-helix transcriptional regulator n=1 Tax=Rodentibacter TaxID=1960084 RepID=UPI001CFCD260|nr:PAS domain-containing protein [Rodentibacter sp. JRC1]GJI56564.1 hypothetical protein HEMROJRC1_16760 [Rodentibacter sp. JRC1]
MNTNLDYLSDYDRQIMFSYFSLSHSIANLLGEYCEIVIHSLSQFENSVIKIINGFHTGRKVGSPITDKGLQLLKVYQKDRSVTQQTYFSHLSNGQLIKSTTHIIIGTKGNPIGLFCINLNLSYPMDKIITALIPPTDMGQAFKNENFINNTSDLINETFANACLEVEKKLSKQSKGYKKAIILHLFENGIFELKEAVAVIAEKLNLTSHTIYKHLREFKSQ